VCCALAFWLVFEVGLGFGLGSLDLICCGKKLLSVILSYIIIGKIYLLVVLQYRGDLFKQKVDIVGSWQQPPNFQFSELDAAK